ncbi:hypothetical protein [Candidatus Nitrosotalea bavarica]|uniref:hypothetical protein n=1 Tax=Candidatus Nitrosotalea bavarica TaxID=1903277 RepID=UPI000C71279B|nr:hypothetical protein [Candidatus Nitrosotalea bavarica]
MIQCYNGDCKFIILRNTECSNCGTDNTLEALEIAFKKLEDSGLKDFNEFMLVHFPLKEIRDKHEIRLLSLEKEHLTSKLQKIQKVQVK